MSVPGVSRLTGGGTKFPSPVKPQAVHNIQQGGQKVPHVIPATQLPSHEAAVAHQAQKIAKDGNGTIIDVTV